MLSNSELNKLDGISKKYVDYVVSGLTFSGGGGSGTSGLSGTSGVSGTSGLSGTSGINGTNGTSGIGTSGTSGLNGLTGTSGTSGIGSSGTSGLNGLSIIGAHNPVLASSIVYNQSIGAVAKTTIAGVANRLDLMPFIPARTLTIVNLQIDVTTLISASNARILVYSDLNGTPYTKLVESTNLDCAATGLKTYTVSYTFNAGTTYWIGVHWSSTQTLRGIPVAGLIGLGTPATAGTTNYTLYRLSVAFGSAPSSYSGGTLTSSIGPEIRMTAGIFG